MTRWPPRTSCSAASSASRGDDLEREQQVLDRDEVVAERPRLVEGLVEHAAERCAGLRLGAAGDRRLLPEAGLGLAAQRLRARAGALDDRPRQLLVEKRDRQVVGRQLGIARAGAQAPARPRPPRRS